MKEFLNKVAEKYELEDITGYLGVLLDEHAEEEDIEDSLRFIEDLYQLAVEELN